MTDITLSKIIDRLEREKLNEKSCSNLTNRITNKIEKEIKITIYRNTLSNITICLL